MIATRSSAPKSAAAARLAGPFLLGVILPACADGTLPPRNAQDPANPNAIESPVGMVPAIDSVTTPPPSAPITDAAMASPDHAHMHHMHGVAMDAGTSP